jgi:predicted alternative tryptophan synthase beta-subunit
MALFMDAHCKRPEEFTFSDFCELLSPKVTSPRNKPQTDGVSSLELLSKIFAQAVKLQMELEMIRFRFISTVQDLEEFYCTLTESAITGDTLKSIM